MDGITFQAIFQKFTTLIDGGYRVSFDVSENEAKSLFQLSKMRESVLQVAIVPTESKNKEFSV